MQSPGRASTPSSLGRSRGLSWFLPPLGVYGLLSYTVAQREREIGIRMALGAGSTQIIGLVLGQGAALVGAGTLMGMGTAWGVEPDVGEPSLRCRR